MGKWGRGRDVAALNVGSRESVSLISSRAATAAASAAAARWAGALVGFRDARRLGQGIPGAGPQSSGNGGPRGIVANRMGYV